MAKGLQNNGEELVTVREAVPRDLGAIDDIEQSSFSSPWGFEKWGEDHYSKELAKEISMFLVAEWGGEVIGYTCGRAVVDEGHILKLAVSPEWRRRGIGRMLMDSIMTKLYERGSRLFWLEVRKSNAPARHFYNSLGFGLYGVRKGYYTDTREDALVLFKRMEDWTPERQR